MYDLGRVSGELTQCFTIKSQINQGCFISLFLFSILQDWVLLNTTRACNGILVSENLLISDLSYADDLTCMT